MASLNKVILIGNLGGEPELRKTQGGTPVTSFSIATTEKFTDKQGNRQEQTEWHNIVLWNKQAEIASQYLHKGSSVCVEGKITTRSWENNGQKHYKTEIIASNFTMLGSKQQGQQGSYQQQPMQQPQQQGMQIPMPQQPMGFADHDEMPF